MGAKPPARNREGSDTCLRVQGPPQVTPLQPCHGTPRGHKTSRGEGRASRGSTGDVGVLYHQDAQLPRLSLHRRLAQTRGMSWLVLSSLLLKPPQRANPAGELPASLPHSWAWPRVGFPPNPPSPPGSNQPCIQRAAWEDD